jgi:hypothetical protein
MSGLCRITTLELRSCAITGPHGEWLAGGVLAQCRALVHLDLSGNGIVSQKSYSSLFSSNRTCKPEGRLTHIVPTIMSLQYVALSCDFLSTSPKATTPYLYNMSLFLVACLNLNVSSNGIGPAGIRAAGAERFAGVLVLEECLCLQECTFSRCFLVFLLCSHTAPVRLSLSPLYRMSFQH